MAQIFRAGTGKAEIRFAAADFPLKAFTGQHDAVHARVLLLELQTRFALLSLELTSLPPQAIEHFQAVCGKAFGIEPAQVLVSVTHTFSAPHIPPHTRSKQEKALSEILYDRLDTAIVQACEQALATLQQANLTYGESTCRLNVNRNVPTPQGWWIGRNEDSFSDHTVRVVRFTTKDGTVLAQLVNYDIQPSTMDGSTAADGGCLVSGDLVGAACRELETQGGVAIFLPGCAGDQAPLARAVQPTGDLHEAGFVLAEQFGRYLAERVLAAQPQPMPVNTLALHTITAALPEQKMKYATKELRPHTEYDFELTGNTVPVPLAMLTIGGLRMLATTPELNSAFGGKLREVLGDPLLIATLMNGATKYLPQAQDFANITYTAMNTKLGPGSEDAFLQAAATLR